jgi:hypothetical protein
MQSDLANEAQPPEKGALSRTLHNDDRPETDK